MAIDSKEEVTQQDVEERQTTAEEPQVPNKAMAARSGEPPTSGGGGGTKTGKNARFNGPPENPKRGRARS